MKLIPLQIFAILFALFAFSRALLLFKDGKINWKEFSFWTVIWGGVVVVSLSRSVVDSFSQFFGVQRPVDAMVFISIIMLFYLVYRIYAKFDHVEHEITLLTRKTSLQKKKK